MKDYRQSPKAIYLSGRISGLLRSDVEKLFSEAERHYLEQGYKVLSPLRNGLTPDHSWYEHMAQDLLILQEAHAIAMLPNWKESHGARLELAFAKLLNIEIHYYQAHTPHAQEILNK